MVVGYRSDASSADGVAATARRAGVRAIAVRADVSHSEEIDALFAAAAEQLGP